MAVYGPPPQSSGQSRVVALDAFRLISPLRQAGVEPTIAPHVLADWRQLERITGLTAQLLIVKD